MPGQKEYIAHSPPRVSQLKKEIYRVIRQMFKELSNSSVTMTIDVHDDSDYYGDSDYEDSGSN